MTGETEHPNLAAALVAALADVSVVEKTNTASEGNRGTRRYADMADVVKATRPALAAHGLVALTPVEEHNDGLKCTVVILHSSGDRLEFGPLPFPSGRDAQATGSQITYHRRYALLSALGIAPDDDDDGAGAKPAVAVQREAVFARDIPSEALATEDIHVMVRNCIDNLDVADKPGFAAWWKDQGLPSIKSRDALTDAQADLVFDRIDKVEAARLIQGPAGEGSRPLDGGPVEPSPAAIVGVWSCSHCGPHPDSDAGWCAAGCGRDHGVMTFLDASAGAPDSKQGDEDKNLGLVHNVGMLSPEEEENVRTGGSPADARRVMEEAKARKPAGVKK